MPRTIIRYLEAGVPRWGVQFDQRIAPLDADAATTGALLSDHWESLWSVSAEQATLARDRVQLLAPVTTNQQFLCQGVNYRSHVAESGRRP